MRRGSRGEKKREAVVTGGNIKQTYIHVFHHRIGN
jgi:hypothetical protein